jgi:hypothetical protein
MSVAVPTLPSTELARVWICRATEVTSEARPGAGFAGLAALVALVALVGSRGALRRTRATAWVLRAWVAMLPPL